MKGTNPLGHRLVNTKNRPLFFSGVWASVQRAIQGFDRRRQPKRLSQNRLRLRASQSSPGQAVGAARAFAAVSVEQLSFLCSCALAPARLVAGGSFVGRVGHPQRQRGWKESLSRSDGTTAGGRMGRRFSRGGESLVFGR